VHSNRGNVLLERRQWDAALASYDRALALRADYVEAHFNRGLVLQELRNWNAALSSYDRALSIQKDFAPAYLTRGQVLQELGQWEAALASYDQAIALKAELAEAHFGCGQVRQELKQREAALASYGRAIALKPDFAEAYCNRGLVLQELQQWDGALASYNQAIAVKADFAEAHLNLGNALRTLGRDGEALASYSNALELKPDHPWAYGVWLHMKMHLGDWSGLGPALANLTSRIERGERATQPFEAMTLLDSAPLQRCAAQIWMQATCPPMAGPSMTDRRPKAGRIRLAYYSADFHNSAMAHCMASLFEKHDRERFHTVAFSFGPDRRDEVRKRLSTAFTDFIDVRDKSAREIAQLSRQLEIDIAVDLTGFTRDQRPEIFAQRAAPVQVSYLGYPGTMGAPYIDYLFADRVCIPADKRPQYVEKIVYFPNSYYPTSYRLESRLERAGNLAALRAQVGLPPTGFVFCCFNNQYKITPDQFDIWMRILQKVEGSVLWLLRDSETAVGNLRREARARGVSDARLFFAPRVPLDEHLSRHRAADLFLDTLPCNAHTTASDALWMGLPVLTQAGESLAARVAASLLGAVALQDLVTTTPEQYEATAIALAMDPERLARITDRLNRSRLTTSLFDSGLLTRQMEDVYGRIYERHRQGLAPADIDMAREV
jgi:predicted O-linked N-acetylglucosamine transferase (SPINDLY family)